MSDCISSRFVSDRAPECFLVLVSGTEMAELWTGEAKLQKIYIIYSTGSYTTGSQSTLPVYFRF